MKKPLGVRIQGCVYADDGDLGHDKFLDAFIEFIESKGWQFGGGTVQIDEEGEKIDDID
ncbi:hypothetical protein [Bacillus sp. FJAT-28004]|jgi:uncharacterized protein YggL (DUF469 family)|uniref:hypothetical protein n=1 Tax=Bacillus sp. FJAT-28004 TaxID=1679165 RepID=UPI000A5442A5|nr:hypothetical protein [Bacillus sp. FJAT-28004]